MERCQSPPQQHGLERTSEKDGEKGNLGETLKTPEKSSSSVRNLFERRNTSCILGYMLAVSVNENAADLVILYQLK